MHEVTCGRTRAHGKGGRYNKRGIGGPWDGIWMVGSGWLDLDGGIWMVGSGWWDERADNEEVGGGMGGMGGMV